MKTVLELRDEYCDNGFLSKKSMQEVAWHLENDKDPDRAISLTADAHIIQLAPMMAKHLHHKENYVRELTIGCLLGRLRLPEYAEAGLKMAKEDERGARYLALFCLGKVINDVDKTLQKKIVTYLLEVVNGQVYDDDFVQGSAYNSIMDAMNVPKSKRPKSSLLSRIVDWNLVKAFEEKFLGKRNNLR